MIQSTSNITNLNQQHVSKDQQGLVSAAQAGNTKTLASLCERYEPLIHKYASATPVKIVQKDMENELWCHFLKAVKEYKRETKVPFPGFVQSRIKYGQYNAFKKLRNQWQRESCILIKNVASDRKLETNSLSLEDILEPVPSAESDYLNLHTKRAIRLALQRLEPKQHELLKDIYVKQHSLTYLGKKYNISRQAVFKHKQRAVEALKVYYNTIDTSGLPLEKCTKAPQN